MSAMFAVGLSGDRHGHGRDKRENSRRLHGGGVVGDAWRQGTRYGLKSRGNRDLLCGRWWARSVAEICRLLVCEQCCQSGRYGGKTQSI